MKPNLFHMAKGPAHIHTHTGAQRHARTTLEIPSKTMQFWYTADPPPSSLLLSHSVRADWSVGILKSCRFTGPVHFKEKKCGTIFQVACVCGGGLEDQPSVFTLFIKSVTHKGLQPGKSVSCLKRPSDWSGPSLNFWTFVTGEASRRWDLLANIT